MPPLSSSAPLAPLASKKSFFTFLFASAPRTVLLSIFLAIVAGGFDVATLSIIGEGVRRDQLSWFLVELFAGLTIANVLVKASSRLLLADIVQTAVVDLRANLTQRILRAPLSRLEELGTAKILSILSDDVATLAQSASFLPEMYVSATVLVGGLTYLTWISYRLLVPVVLCATISFAVSKRAQTRGAEVQNKVREATDVVFQYFRTLSDGMKDLKLRQHREAHFCESLLDTSLQQRLHVLDVLRVFYPSMYMGQMLVYALIGLLIFYGPLEVHNKAASVFAVLFVAGPIATLSNLAPQIMRANVIFRRLGESGLSDDTALESRVARPAYALPWQRIALQGVTHTYQNEYADRVFTLGPIDLEFRPGEIVFIVGGNGSGKTTLAKIIMGLYPPDRGSIAIDGSQVGKDDLSRYRELFSATFADSYIFESILGGSDTSNDEACHALLKKLQLDHKVSIKNGAFSTVALSQGQRKRLALVSVYAEDRSFLVFDEWAADQDPVFKDLFYRTLLPELKAKGKTIVAISHDDRYFPCADRILMIENGQLTDTAKLASNG